MSKKIVSEKDDSLVWNCASMRNAKQILMDTVIGAKIAKSRIRANGKRRDLMQGMFGCNMLSLKRMHDFALQDVEPYCSSSQEC
jgi:hypothetical protein